MNVKLIRIESSADGTFGVLLINGKSFCVSLELENPIPDGEYECEKYMSPKRGEVWQLKNVPGRTYIQIHSGNTILDTLLCILIGQYFDKLRGNRAILNSGKTFEKFMDITRNEIILKLTVITVP